MKIVYEIPNKEYAVVEQTDPEWQKTFGIDATYYNAVKISSMEIVYTGINITSILKWFRKMNVISEDEMNFQIENRKK